MGCSDAGSARGACHRHGVGHHRSPRGGGRSQRHCARVTLRTLSRRAEEGCVHPAPGNTQGRTAVVTPPPGLRGTQALDRRTLGSSEPTAGCASRGCSRRRSCRSAPAVADAHRADQPRPARAACPGSHRTRRAENSAVKRIIQVPRPIPTYWLWALSGMSGSLTSGPDPSAYHSESSVS